MGKLLDGGGKFGQEKKPEESPTLDRYEEAIREMGKLRERQRMAKKELAKSSAIKIRQVLDAHILEAGQFIVGEFNDALEELEGEPLNELIGQAQSLFDNEDLCRNNQSYWHAVAAMLDARAEANLLE